MKINFVDSNRIYSKIHRVHLYVDTGDDTNDVITPIYSGSWTSKTCRFNLCIGRRECIVTSQLMITWHVQVWADWSCQVRWHRYPRRRINQVCAVCCVCVFVGYIFMLMRIVNYIAYRFDVDFRLMELFTLWWRCTAIPAMQSLQSDKSFRG